MSKHTSISSGSYEPYELAETAAAKEKEADDKRDLQLLGPDENTRNECSHPDKKADEVFGLKVGARGEVVLHVGKACSGISTLNSRRSKDLIIPGMMAPIHTLVA